MTNPNHAFQSSNLDIYDSHTIPDTFNPTASAIALNWVPNYADPANPVDQPILNEMISTTEQWAPMPMSNPSSALPSAPAFVAPFSPKPGSTYFEANNHIEAFESKRNYQRTLNMAHRTGSPWTEEDEYILVNKLWVSWFNEEWPGNDWVSKTPALNLDRIIPSVKERGLPPFKINYQTYHEIKLRLLGTVIMIKGAPFHVARVREKNNGFILGVVSSSGVLETVLYRELQDLRSIPPMYITTSSTGWLCRVPARVYQQGINRNNTQIRTVDGGSILYNIDPTTLVRAIDRRVDKKWHSSYESLMESGELSTCRLSDEMAVVGSTRTICYRGRALGTIKDGCVFCDDEDDLQQQWIENAAKDVGLELRAA